VTVATQLDQLYQQVILDHYKQKHGHGLRGPEQTPDRAAVGEGELVWAESRQVNPLCGDEVTLRVAVDASGLVRDVAWTGEGCSISQASTSVLHDLAVDEPVADARRRIDAFRAMVRSRGTLEPDEELLGDGVAFAGVGRHANRVKCAMLGWTAFEDALGRADAPAGVPSQAPNQEGS
jgi:nitrogen fixation protein NifU and related proteins